jgi:thioredoxin 1
MKFIILLIFFASEILLASFAGAQTPASGNAINASAFAAKIKQYPDAPVVDVRTPKEFSSGHISNAVNINWNSPDFNKHIALLDKSKPVMIYCLSGARSSAAANKMRASGFKEVYELDGGILKWRAANLEEVRPSGNSAGMTRQQFNKMLLTNKTVLVDFYADWCLPCKKMKPYLDEISKDMHKNVMVIRINADENPALCKELNVDALPVLQVYKSNKMTWSNKGYIDKASVVKQLQ